MLITEKTRFLCLPISQSAAQTKLRLLCGGRLLLDLDVKLDPASPDTEFYYDLTPYLGLEIDFVHESGHTFAVCERKPPLAGELYRPLLHFAPDRGWHNDPNGMIFYEGRWHLFFQHNPVGNGWGNMHWGHAVSSDLLHWQDLGDILSPDEMGDMYSGSAIVDHGNLLGVRGDSEHETLVLFYTAAGDRRELNRSKPCVQCIAYSTDGGFTFQKYAGNPVVGEIFRHNRDPKVVCDPDSGLYVMSIYLEKDEYAILTSKDLVNWTHIQTFPLPGDNECPEFVPMSDENGRTRWVLSGAHDCYCVGDFDPVRGFINRSMTKKLGFGALYAAQSFSETGDKRIRISWCRYQAIPAKEFNCTMGIPCELLLHGDSLRIRPISAVAAAGASTDTFEGIPSHGFRSEISCPSDLELCLSDVGEPITLNLFGCEIRLDAAAGSITVGEASMPLCAEDGRISLRIIADTYGTEIFAGYREDRGAPAYGAFPWPNAGHNPVLHIGGEGRIDRLAIREF